jgi:hypothetical protein
MLSTFAIMPTASCYSFTKESLRLPNQPFGSLRALEAVMTDFLRAFWEDARRVVNLIGEGWLLTQANHFFCQHSTAMSG